MRYICFVFEIEDSNIRDMFIAYLGDIGFEGFEEQDKALLAFIERSNLDENLVSAFAVQNNVQYKQEEIENINWNQKWEQDFKPVIVGDFCTIRAHFHDIPVTTTHDIIITPKMSFGTGHHATTQLMVKQMADIDFQGKKVFDFGTGTGILAILAEKLGADSVVAIDNDEWSVENTNENIARNNCVAITAMLGSLESYTHDGYDITLANINRNILLQYMDEMYNVLNAGGLLLMSGLLKEDRQVITEAVGKTGFILQQEDELNNWIVLLCEK
jgi:ribosomal protein L11 methyltransferase